MAETIPVATARAYEVRVGSGVRADVEGALRGSAALITDENVAEACLPHLDVDLPGVVVEAGEASKTLATLDGVLEFMAEVELDRGSTLVALGGGVVGDLGGLAASMYMRGIGVVHVPTTLLAMVDSSVGGKTAVNLDHGKNLAGTVHQPLAVFSDTDFLVTLPDEEIESGLGEVVKSALVGDETLLDFLAENAEAVGRRDAAALGEVVLRCVRVKSAVVAGDETEEGGREVLNLGHTFGHAIERVAGYGEIPHGVAVAAGLGLALEASREAGILTDGDLPERTAGVLRSLGLPAGLGDLREATGLELPAGPLADAMRLDKKGRAGATRFVLVRAAGHLERGVELDPALLSSLLAPA